MNRRQTENSVVSDNGSEKQPISKEVILTTTQEEREAEFERVMEDIQAHTATPYGPKYRYKTEYLPYSYTTLSGYAGNQVVGGYKFPTCGGFWFSDVGGPTVSGSVSLSLPAPFNIVHFVLRTHQFWGTYCTGDEPFTDNLYLVLQKNGQYTIYKQFEVLEKGSFEELPSDSGTRGVTYKLISEAGLSERNLVYEKESGTVVILGYQDEDIVFRQISKDALFINVDVTGHTFLPGVPCNM